MLPYFTVDRDIFLIQNKLHNIISISVSHKFLCMRNDLRNERFLLAWSSAINALLHDTAPMLVTWDLSTLINHLIEDEVVIGSLKSCQTFLNHMIPIDVFYQRFDMRLKNLDDLRSEFWSQTSFYDFLNWSCSMRVIAKLE